MDTILFLNQKQVNSLKRLNFEKIYELLLNNNFYIVIGPILSNF